MTDIRDVLSEVEQEIDAAKALAAQEPQPSESLNLKLSRFAKLELARRDLEAELKKVKEIADAMREPLWEEMVACGMTNANVHGLRLYGRQVVAVSKRSEVETDSVCHALQAIGRGDMVRDSYNASSLTALVKEWMAEGKQIPSELAPVLNVFEKTVLTSGL